jgi:hypothetical protein
MKPQSAAILRLLEKYPASGVTQQDAIAEAQCYRLAARISDLKADGIDIRTELMRRNGRTFALYRLVPKDEQLTVGL